MDIKKLPETGNDSTGIPNYNNFNLKLNLLGKHIEKVDQDIQKIIDDTGVSIKSLYTMTNLSNINTDNTDYLKLLSQNLENLKLELYK